MTAKELILKLQEFPPDTQVKSVVDSTIEYDGHYPFVEFTWGEPDIFISGGVIFL